MNTEKRTNSTKILYQISIAIILPTLSLTIYSFVVLGVSFPGYCENLDGEWRVGPGISGFWQFTFGESSGYSDLGLIVFSVSAIVFLFFWSFIIMEQLRNKESGVRNIIIIYSIVFLIASLILWSNEWTPKFDESKTFSSGFLPNNSITNQ